MSVEEEKIEPTLANENPLTSQENPAPSDTPQPMEISQDEPPTTTTTTITTAAAPLTDAASPSAPPMSKNALKRLRKKQAWDDAKGDRRDRRREKRRNQKDRIRSERAALIAQGADPESFVKKPLPSTLVPVSIVLDCDFERYMNLKERISLSSQVTRSYSDNKQARYRSHLWVAGFNGAIAQRFHEVLGGQHKAWKGVSFCEGDFLVTAREARQQMQADGGEMIEPLQKSLDERPAWIKDETDPFPMPDPAPPLDENNMDVVYLSSDSPYTLERLEPNTCYVVGGLVDKNREKGLCYKRARERGIRTARLPIGQFMVMQSRQVLATNHVVEIMLKWLECGDWGQAFLSVIPKRKGAS
ncbi:tRNA (guanine(9)-N1)-methyltransferase [Cladobotryum mycophilum]|uniref:tRNA (guanine(9)-N1)-methyltransferase n=1 Tax=Cladobotryum mycophilum TaxID=491253 RepID=A0ABR0SU76_9HYPO